MHTQPTNLIHTVFTEGTEAAAATAVMAAPMCLPRASIEINFRADRPFLFSIRHNQTKSILFLGRLAKPVA